MIRTSPMALPSDSLLTGVISNVSVEAPGLLSSLPSESVFANPDPLGGLEATDAISLVAASNAMDALDAVIADLTSQVPGLDLMSVDQLTGLAQGGTPSTLSLLDYNLPPLLAPSFAADGLLVSPESSLQSYTLFEDQIFTLDLSGFFSELKAPNSVVITPLQVDDSTEWLQFDQRLPDASLAERLVIEGLFYDSLGNVITADVVSTLAVGSPVQMDLVVTDTRYDGQGLIGLELDLLWNPQALALEQVQIAPTLPLFRNIGLLDSSAGTLTGLVAASLPSGGSGQVLADSKRELFASLDFRIGPDAFAGLNLVLLPHKLPTRGNQALDATHVVAVDSKTAILPVVTGQADQSQVGVHTYLLQALDDAGQPWQQTLSLTIVNVNDAPVALPYGPITVLEDQPLTLNLAEAFRDEDLAVGDVLTYQLLEGSPRWLQFNASSGLLQGSPGNSHVGSYQFDVEARDLSGTTARQTISLLIDNVNDAPTWTGDTLPEILVREGSIFEIKLPYGFIRDVDIGDQIQYSLDLTTAPDLVDLLVVNPVTGAITGQVSIGQASPFTFGLVASDLAGASTTVELQLRVVDRDFNRSPYRIGMDLFDHTIQEGESVSFLLPSLFYDDDLLIGDQLHFDVDLPDWLQFDSSSGRVFGLAKNDAVGEHPVSFRAYDNRSETSTASFLLRVENTNQAPERLVAAVEERQILVDSPFQLNLNNVFRDIDVIHGDRLSLDLKLRSTASLGMPSGLSFDAAQRTLSFTPGVSDRGKLNLLFTASDRKGASSTYQLDLGIISPNGLLEVDQPLQDLVLRQDTRSVLDLSGAFAQLSSSSNLTYTVEAFRLGKDAQLTSIRDSSWLNLFDRRLEDSNWQDTANYDTSSDSHLSIASVLRLADTGHLLRPEDLSSLPINSALQLDINVTDLRQSSAIPGVIGLDLGLKWSGLQLIDSGNTSMPQAITSDFPLFRQVDSSEIDNNYLRFSAASLPSLGIGEVLGDTPNESFVSLDFLLKDPSKPVRLDLKLNREDQGGLGIGFADGSNPGPNVQLNDFSTNSLMELLLRPGADQIGNLVLRITAQDSDHDSVSQLVRVRVEPKDDKTAGPLSGLGYYFLDYDDSAAKTNTAKTNAAKTSAALKERQAIAEALAVAKVAAVAQIAQPKNRTILAPAVIGFLNKVSSYERKASSVSLSDLFSNPNTDEQARSVLNYDVSVKSSSDDNQTLLSKYVTIDRSTSDPRLVIDSRGLVDILSGQVRLVASIEGLESSQVFDVELIPRSEAVPILVTASQLLAVDGEPTSIGRIFGAAPLVIGDSSDFTELSIRSSEVFTVILSKTFRDEAGLTDDQATSLQAQWLTRTDSSNNESIIHQVVVPISDLLNLLGPELTRFDLDWIEVVPIASSSRFLPIEISTSTMVRGDNGNRFGIQESPRFQSTLILPEQLIEDQAEAGLSMESSLSNSSMTSPGRMSGSSFLDLSLSSGISDRLITARPVDIVNGTGGPAVGGGTEAGGPALARPKGSQLKPSSSADASIGGDQLLAHRSPRSNNSGDPYNFKGLFDNLMQAFNNSGSLAGLVIAMISMPGSGERGLRSLLLHSKLGQAIQLQRRNPELECAWTLRLGCLDGQPLSIILQLRNGQLTLLEDATCEDHPCSGSAPISVGVLDRESPLWKVLQASPHPGDLLADISCKLDLMLTSNEVDIDWVGWLNSLAKQTCGPDARPTRAALGELQQTVILALSIDQSMADAVMVSQLLNCQVLLGVELPWLRT